jgi:hypothetical protein
MDFKLYNDCILVPVKCGTRFLLDSGFEETDNIPMNELQRIPNIPNLKYIIVRDPMEHFLSAIRQDIVPVLDKKMSKKKRRDKINSILEGYRNVDGLKGLHYYTKLYKLLYRFWRKTKNKDFQIVNINNLSKLLSILGFPFKYDESKYFLYQPHIDKNELAIWLKSNYEIPFNLCMDDITNDIIFYNALISGEMLSIEMFEKLI